MCIGDELLPLAEIFFIGTVNFFMACSVVVLHLEFVLLQQIYVGAADLSDPEVVLLSAVVFQAVPMQGEQ